MTFQIPTFRVDLKREVDLVEEIARLYGVDKIPATPPRGASGTNAFDVIHDQLAEARRILSGLGLNEAQGQTLVSGGECRVASAGAAILANPLSSDMDVLRPSLLPGLIHSLRHNVSHKNYDVALFEVGRVFAQGGDDALRCPYQEERRVKPLHSPVNAPCHFWSGGDRGGQKFSMPMDLKKGLLEEFFDQFGLRGMTFYTPRGRAHRCFSSRRPFRWRKNQIGRVIRPALAGAGEEIRDLRDAAFNAGGIESRPAAGAA